MKALCRFYGKCSGCTLQHFPYVKQLHDKNRELRRRFAFLTEKNGSPDQDAVLKDIVESPEPFAYRISSKLCLHEDETGRRAIGLYQQGSKSVSDIPSCPVHHPALNKLLQKLFPVGFKAPAPFYNHKKKAFQPERFKFLTLRYCPETGAAAAVISHTGVERKVLEAWALSLRLPELCLYESRLSRDDEDLVLSRSVQHLNGPKDFLFHVAGFTFALNPLAFFQANYSLAPKFVETIVENLGGETLLDLYGGFGAYSFASAARFKKIYLVETNEHSLAAARSTADGAGIKIIQTMQGRVETFLAKFSRGEEAGKVSHIICNPPRGGLSPEVKRLLSQIAWTGLQGLTYVSCHPETLARDLDLLLRQGPFELESIRPFDMFPQTGHVELVVKLRSRARGKPGTQAQRSLEPRRARFRREPGSRDKRESRRSQKISAARTKSKSAGEGSPPIINTCTPIATSIVTLIKKAPKTALRGKKNSRPPRT